MTSYSDGAMRAASRLADDCYGRALHEMSEAEWAKMRDRYAAIISEETGDVELREALEGVILACGPTGDSFQDFEEQAATFQRETGKMRPGKDVPAAAGDLGATHAEYSAWVQGKLSGARAALSRAKGDSHD